MRILLVSDHYPPFIGGAHRQTRLLGQQLTARGHTVAVVTVWHPGLPAETDEDGVTVYRLRQLRTLLPFTRNDRQQQHQPPFPDPVTVLRLRRLINRFQPDLVHSYGWYTYTSALALWRKDIPLVISVRDYAYSCAKRTLIHESQSLCDGPALGKCMACAGKHFGQPKGAVAVLGVALGRRLLHGQLQGIHSISRYVQQMMHRDFLGNVGPVSSGPGGLEEAIIPSFMMEDEVEYDPEEVAPYVAQLPDEPFILFVGALRKVKGVEHLLEAYQRLSDPPPLVLIGTVEYDTPKTFPPGVAVLEDFPHQAVMAAWDRALFGVIPSLWPEPLGSVIYEGMIQGKAVIGTSPGGHTDMISHEQTGLLVPGGDVDALQTAMERLLQDEGLRERLARAAQVRARSFTAAVNVPRFERLYRRVVDRHAGRLTIEPAPAHE